MQTTHPLYKITRLAPTPSGFLHTGNLLSFSLTAWLARESGARILLRIDDLDAARAREAYIDDIFENLTRLKIPWQTGPVDKWDYLANYSQQKRKPLYDKLLDELREKDAVYACRCSRSEIADRATCGIYSCNCRQEHIPLDEKGMNWRLDTSANFLLEVKSASGAVVKKALPDSMQDFVVRKKDDNPAYQLASLADDCFYKTDLIVRGEDLWDSTLAQLYLARIAEKTDFLGTAFFHHPLLKDESGIKLSKSAGAEALHSLFKRGWSGESVYQLTAKRAGLEGEAADWLSLAALFIEKYHPENL